jgi:hypothetical protein
LTKRLLLALAFLGLLITFSRISWAAAITLGFVGVKTTPPVAVNSTGVTLTEAPLLSITDTNTNNVFIVPGSVNMWTGAASSYLSAGGVLTAMFSALPGIEAQADSANCVGGTNPGVCLQGSLNGNRAYVASQNSTGSFQALFHADYVSPWVTSLFGDPNAWLPRGSDSFTTGHNNFSNGGTTDSATAGAGQVTFQTVPGSSSLTLMGSGLLGLAGVVRHKAPD